MKSENGVALFALIIVGFFLLIVASIGISLAIKGMNADIEPSTVYSTQIVENRQ